MMGAMMYLERTWTAVSFQLDCTSAQLEQLRPTYRNTLNARDAAMKTPVESQDWSCSPAWEAWGRGVAVLGRRPWRQTVSRSDAEAAQAWDRSSIQQ